MHTYHRLVVLVLCLAGWAVLAGCASGFYQQGKTHLEAEEYSEAVGAFLQALQEDPENSDAWRDLGIAYFRQGSLDKALRALEKAHALNSRDGRTVFYLGAVYEVQEDYDRAIEYYRQYIHLGRFSSMRKTLEARLELLTRKKIEAEIRAALAQEQYLNPDSIPENSLAVLYFRNLGENRDLDPLQKGLAELLIIDLSKVNDLRLVERIRLQELLDELRLGASGAVDPATAPRIGKLLGARRLVMGNFLNLDEKTLRIDAHLIGTPTGEVKPAGEVSGTLNDLFRLEKQMVFALVDEMGIRLTREEREAIQEIPTENLLAFMAYAEGLDREDRGLYDEARSFYQRAATLDPDFGLAKQHLESVQRMEESAAVDVHTLQRQMRRHRAPDRHHRRRTRLARARHHIHGGFLPGRDSRKPLQEETGASGFGRIPVDVEVILPTNKNGNR
ncbi:MAG: tetratricopeptide repeat protein [Calditrichaeota bacterium]|nr:MAG: tetratricopeptide repeat protein [Calditrichota bacterium]